jgi:hypothetical protein
MILVWLVGVMCDAQISDTATSSNTAATTNQLEKAPLLRVTEPASLGSDMDSQTESIITLSGRALEQSKIAAALKLVAEGTCTALTLSNVQLSEEEVDCLRDAC